MLWVETLIRQAMVALEADPDALEACWSRGVSDEQRKTYRVGYLDGLPELADPMASRFLAWANSSELTRSLVFPLTGPMGHVTGFQFRTVDPKVKRYSEFIVDPTAPAVFGLAQALPALWKSESVWLVEGVYDLFAIQRVEPAVLATLTAGVSPGLIPWLRRLVTTVYAGFDMDPTGRRAVKTLQASGIVPTIVPVVYPTYPYRGRTTKDPGEIWETGGDPTIRAIVHRVKGL